MKVASTVQSGRERVKRRSILRISCLFYSLLFGTCMPFFYESILFIHFASLLRLASFILLPMHNNSIFSNTNSNNNLIINFFFLKHTSSGELHCSMHCIHTHARTHACTHTHTHTNTYICYYTPTPPPPPPLTKLGRGVYCNFLVCLSHLSVGPSMRYTFVRKIFGEPLNCMQPNLVRWWIIMTRSVVQNDWVAVLKVKVRVQACTFARNIFCLF